jgi:SAM-dependent methyltransferase
MATREDVTWAYRMLLGRDPESEIIIQGHMEKSLPDLRNLILQSEEFRHWGGAAAFATKKSSLEDPSIDVDLDVSPEILSRMIARVEQNFSYMGKTEPYWSVDSREKFRIANAEKHKDDFFMYGKGPVNELRATLGRCGINTKEFKTCFELGCGLGRTTIWLAEMFSHVFAVDISAAHLNAAREAVRERGRFNVSFVLSDTFACYDNLPQFDVFFSIIVLQHNSPPVIAHVLRTLLRKLNRGGIAYFQVPTYRSVYSFKAARYVESELQLGIPEMHIIPQPELFRVLADVGCQLIEIREDTASGPGWLSNRVLARKL